MVSGTNSQWYMAVRANCALDQLTVANKSMLYSFDFYINSIIDLAEVFAHCLCPLCIVVETAKNIGHKKQPYNSEHHYQFDNDYNPQSPAYGHASETVGIKMIYALKQVHSFINHP